jgi:hypothetical protein
VFILPIYKNKSNQNIKIHMVKLIKLLRLNVQTQHFQVL